MRDMPVMHVFVVVPVPEREEMIPRTYDTLAVLGQQEAMTGQNKMIDEINASDPGSNFDMMGNAAGGSAPLPEFVQHANEIDKPSARILESKFGLKVSVAML